MRLLRDTEGMRKVFPPGADSYCATLAASRSCVRFGCRDPLLSLPAELVCRCALVRSWTSVAGCSYIESIDEGDQP